MTEEKNKRIKKEVWSLVVKHTHVGLIIGLSTFFLMYFGSLLDTKFGTRLVFTVIGFIWGFAGSMIYVYFILKRLESKKDTYEKKDK